MGLGSLLFGSEPKAETKTKNLLNDQQKEMLNQLNTMFKGNTFDFKPLTEADIANAPLSNLEQSSLSALEEMSTNKLQLDTQLQAKAKETMLQNLFTSQEQVEEEFRSSVQDPLMRDFQEQVLPSISRRFAGDSFAGERTDQELSAVDNLAKTIASERSRFFGAERDRQVGAASSAYSAAQTEANIALALRSNEFQEVIAGLQAGKVPRDAALAEITRQLGGDQATAELLLKAIGLNTQENITTVTPGSTGLVGAFASGAGQALGSAAAGKLFG